MVNYKSSYSVIFAGISVFFALVILTPGAASASWIQGDADNNGQVNIVDALIVAQNYVGLGQVPVFLINADVNGDLNLTILDALIIAQYYVGEINSFPIDTQQYNFQDSLVRAAAIQALNKAPGDEITRSELRTIQVLEVESNNAEVVNFADVTQMLGLEELFVDDCIVNDAAPIDELTELQQPKVGEGDPDQAPVPAFYTNLDKVTMIPPEPKFSNQWSLRNSGENAGSSQGFDIKFANAWYMAQGLEPVLVGVAETGDVDVFHGDLENRIHINPAESEEPDGIDTDQNGCIDDRYGCDFKDNDGVYNGTSHATHVAGIISADLNANGIIGVAPGAQLHPLTCEVTNQSFIDAVNWVKQQNAQQDMGMRIINVSQGGYIGQDVDIAHVSALCDVISSAPDILFVCSAGNRGFVRYNYPASCDASNILSVANVDYAGNLWPGSNYGDHVDIAAPGREILSCSNRLADANGVLTDRYTEKTGTSQAAPHVAGVAALIMMKYPDLSVSQVIDRITSTAMRMTTLKGMVKFGAMVDAESALNGVGPIGLDATTTSGTISLFWDIDDDASRYEIEIDGTDIFDNGSANTFVHSNLSTDSGHIYRVRAVHSNRVQPWSHRLFAMASQMPQSEDRYLSSPNPYPDNFNQEYSVTKTSASSIRVHFSLLETEEGPDYIQCTYPSGGDDDIDEQISGYYPDGFWTPWTDGDTFTFWFRTNDSVSSMAGFVIDRIEYFQ
ncbi:MAG: S8 family serine peptidase [Sedimentisphaerales bacterium]|nr:S8 family serine peptidase [Sedimentisphaerales bacterium]